LRAVSEHEQVVEWRPTASDTVVWSVVGLVLIVLGLPLFALPSILRASSAGLSIRIGLGEILLVVVLTGVLLVAHEGIHGLVMLLFGAQPRFGATLVGGSMLIVAAGPAVVISALGFWACFGPWIGYLVLPLAIHLGGCVGDAFAFLRVLREAPGTKCEDLRDGIRFYRPTVSI
jgi:hypothetical protein